MPLPSNDALKELRNRIHAGNVARGWWSDLETGKRKERDPGELLFLAVTELAEGMEGYRKNLNDDKLFDRKMIEVELADAAIRIYDFAAGFDVILKQPELAGCSDKIMDAPTVGAALILINSSICKGYEENNYALWLPIALCQIYTLGDRMKLDIGGALEEKLEYNALREDHSIAARRGAHGKKI